MRAYCGDVPVKAVLLELSRLGAAQIKNGHVHLVEQAGDRIRRTLGGASPLIRATSDALGRIGLTSAEHGPSILSASIELHSRSDHAVIRQRIDSTLLAAFDALQSLGERPVTRGAGKRRHVAPTVMGVSAIVTTDIRVSGRKKS